MLEIKFRTDNAAFDDSPEFETARILRKVADKIEQGLASGRYQNILDSNGNIVGTWKAIFK